jgi:hypothetical protein
MQGGSSLTDRAASVAASVARLRQDVPAIEWRTGQLLAQLADLASIVQDLASTAAADNTTPRPVIRTAAKDHVDRDKELQRLSFLACRALAPNLEGTIRDKEIARILAAWGVTATEIAYLGYQA